MGNEVGPEVAAMSEKVSTLLRKIEEYKSKKQTRARFIKAFSQLHSEICPKLASLNVAGYCLSSLLDITRRRIVAGRDDLIEEGPVSYKKILLCAGQLLTGVSKRPPLECHIDRRWRYFEKRDPKMCPKRGPNLFIGWQSMQKVPKEARDFSRLVPGAAAFLNLDGGWIAFICPEKVLETHFFIVRSEGCVIQLILSDFMPSSSDAKKEVLTSEGLRLTSEDTIQRAEVEPYDMERYVYLTSFEGGRDTLEAVVQTVRRSKHFYFINVNAPWGEAKKRETFIMKRILEAGIRNPSLPCVDWLSEVIADSTLSDTFGFCSYSKMRKVLDKLATLRSRELLREARREYRFRDPRLIEARGTVYY
jgi:hypothetical protein